MSSKEIENSLETILTKYSESFSEKVFSEQSSAEDDLMRVFGLTQEMKSNNRQYWGRELGACWERLVKELCQLTCDRFQEPHNTSYDLAIAKDAIDTKYRLGSGDEAYQYLYEQTQFDLQKWLRDKRDRFAL